MISLFLQHAQGYTSGAEVREDNRVHVLICQRGEWETCLSQFGIECDGCGHFAVNQDFGVFTMKRVNSFLYLCWATQAVFPEIGV